MYKRQGLRFGGGDLVQAEAQQIGLLGALAGPGRQLLQLGGDRAQPLVGGGVLGERDGDGVPGVTVQCLALPGRAQQALLIGLAVHGDQIVRQLAQQADRYGPAAQMGARAALGGDGAADQQRPVVQLRAGLLGPQGRRSRGGDGDPALHHGRSGADPHQGGIRAPAEQQAEAGDDHGLTRARLAGHRREARGQLDNGVVNDAQGPDPHLLQHGYDHTRSGGRPATASPFSSHRVTDRVRAGATLERR